MVHKVHAVIEVREHTDYRQLTEKIEVPEGQHIQIMPGETGLGITQERLRLGLMAHISAPFMGPGIDSQQVLEMSNFGPAPWPCLPAPPSASSCSRSCRAASAMPAASPARRKTPSDHPQLF